MKLKEKSIELLNRAVADELTAVHQYMYFHFHCDDMGYDTISSIFKRIAITEMMHVERLAERILFLKGEVEMKTSKGVQKITDVEKMLEKEGIAVAGCPAKEGKIAFRDWEFYEKAGKLADVILVEADGSKRLPVKVPGPKEPVIPENSDQILCIYGLGALGKQAADCCFRMQPSEQLLKIPEDQKDGKWIMTEKKMSLLMKKGYLEPLRQQFPYSQVIPVFNQADTMKLEENGKNILERMEEERGILTGELWKETSFNLF